MSLNRKAVALLSGGLDSTLAVRMMIDQGIVMTAVHFTSVFCNCTPKKAGCKMQARKVAEEESEQRSERRRKREDLLAATEKEELTPDQSGRLCLLSARAYRAMSLDENAVAALRKGLAADAEGQTQCGLNVELAQCLADTDEPEKAHSLLTDTLGRMKAGPAAHAATCDLAEICLKLEKPQQAVTLCQELLKAELTPPEQAAAREILGRAYVQQKEYDKAAMALAGLTDGSGPAKESPMKQAGVTEK